jgi:UDP-N-acetylglucosamine 1-carboxyvinyltransferase
MGVEVETYDDYLTVRSNGTLKPTNIQTLPYPGFPTDMHPQFAALLCLADGESSVYETIWKKRFNYALELEKMGANVIINEPFAMFKGVEKLHGATVSSVDLRGGAALVIAGLVAEGTTEIVNISTIERGYLDIVGKLKELGADISKVYIDENAFI